MESTAITTRDLKAGSEVRFWGVNVVFRSRGAGRIRLSHHSLSAAVRGGNLFSTLDATAHRRARDTRKIVNTSTNLQKRLAKIGKLPKITNNKCDRAENFCNEHRRIGVRRGTFDNDKSHTRAFMKKSTSPGLILLAALFLAPILAYGQVNTGSTGSDGALDLSSITNATNVVIDMSDHPNGIYNYTYINIPSYVAVTFVPNANNAPVTWLVQSNVLINGTVNVSGQGSIGAIGGLGGPGGWAGGSGGSNPTAGQGPGGGVAGSGGSYGGLGAAFGGTGNSGVGPTYGNSFLLPLVGGSGGGSGGNLPAAGGGGGAGAILIAASNSIQLNGSVIAAGGGGGYANNGGGSGGGSGGGIRLAALVFGGTGTISAAGGLGSYSDQGGVGRIRIDAYQFSFGGTIGAGIFSQGFQPIIVPATGRGVQLAIASVGGSAVPATPSGQLVTPDAIIPGQENNPIPVVVNCYNIPLSTAITVTVDPAVNGSPVSAIGYNNSGTLASSTATVPIVIPRGGGIIYATAVVGN